MRRFLARITPKSLAGQFTLLLAAALLFANLLALAMLNSEQARFAREARFGAQTERIASLYVVLQTLPARARDDVAEAASTRLTRFSVDARPRLSQSGDGRFARILDERLEEALEDALEDDGNDDAEMPVARIAASIREHQRRRFGRARIGRIDASVAMGDGTWLNVVQRYRARPPSAVGPAVLFALIFSLVAVLLVAVIFARRIARPLKALSVAAERAGAGDRMARVDEKGPREVRLAARAFNAMQRRIALFDAEQARTIAAVGHDLRTPITSLRIRAEMLDDETRDGFVKTLDEMGVMASGLLDYGRSGADSEEPGPVDLGALLADLAGTDGQVVYEGPGSCVLTGRPVALRRAFENLVSNARRYARNARIALVETKADVTVTVADDGPGIPQERLRDMLEPFTRLDPSRSSQTGGAGLGLAIANTIVRAHGGALLLKNRQDGPGLMATVRLPRN